MQRRAALLCLALALVGLPAAANVQPWTHRGLSDPTGADTSLAESASGRRLVVVTMKGHWCPVCLAQLARLGRAKSRLEKLSTQVVGLDADSPKANREAARQLNLPFPILSDPKHRVLDALGLWRSGAGQPMPALVVFDECGAERARLVGRRPGQHVERSLFRVLQRIADHPPRCSGHGNT